MDQFNYLAVLISIILGLGITQLLTGAGRLINLRARVRWYLPVPVWLVVLLLIHVLTWWTMFGLRTHGDWTFAGFLVTLLQPIVLYLITALLVPELPAEGPIDLRVSYYAHARWLFSLLLTLLVASFVRPYALGDSRPMDADAATHGVLFVLGVIGLTTRAPRYHELVSLVNLVIIVAYIALLFARLH